MITVRGCSFPEDRYYDVACNVWLKPGEDGLVTLGATSFGVALAGEFIAFVPKPAGMSVDAGRAVGLLEIAKSLVSVRTPVAAVIVEANAAAVTDTGLINHDPYHRGWLMRLQIDCWEAARKTMLHGAEIFAAFDAAMALENFSSPSNP
jgi:glycine cleavage system H protein